MSRRFGKYGLQVIEDTEMGMFDVYTTDDEGQPDTLVNSFKEKCDAIEWVDMMED